ncbi:DUF499 domain-containing protein [Paenibacillus sp. FSL M8-0142]|uniref:ATP-binding protein n=1 Tax=Paenibacillus sp. FSL M8-0142 TaxID=2954525 RepID=UPI003159CC8C
MSIKSWREIAIPHQDVLQGTFQQSEFAADLSRVHQGSASPEYGDAKLFYSRTFITKGMELLLDSVIKRLSGNGGDPVIQLQTAFGGGKTHTMLAVYHLASGQVPLRELQGIASIVDAAGIMEVPKAQVVVLDGNDLSPNQAHSREGVLIHTMWGELAWQLGKTEAYNIVKAADVSGTSPGKAQLTELLSKYSPCVILIDELVAYLRQFEEGRTYAGGTFDSNLSFIQALTEALKAVPQAIMLASLPESNAELGGIRGQQAFDALEKYFGRVQALWKPVATEEAFEIVRRRLFTNISDVHAVEEVCRAYSELYVQNSTEFPSETQEMRYLDRLKQSYPIHPEVFDRLYEDWSSLDKFQRTRGVLKLMAKVIHKLWTEGNASPMIQCSDLPLNDQDVRNELVYYLPQGWDPVLERDVDGHRSETVTIDRDSRFGAYQAARRVGRTIFLGSAPSVTLKSQRGIDQSRILLGCVQPGQTIGVYKDVLRRMSDVLHYLNNMNNRFYYDTRPNLRREMEERKQRFTDTDSEIRARLTKLLNTRREFTGIHIFTPSADIPDDEELRLVVLPTNGAYNRSAHNQAFTIANEILTKRGNQPRSNQNRLIFMAADYEAVRRLRESIRTVLSWQSIVNDIKDDRLNLDRVQQKQAEEQLARSQDVATRTLRETFKWLLVPYQEALRGQGVTEVAWEAMPIQPNANDVMVEIANKLSEDGLLITTWAPIHLSSMLKTWFWKNELNDAYALDVWKNTCQYLYLPRLHNQSVYQQAIDAGVRSRDFFGVAYGREGEQYQGFALEQNISVILDGTTLLIHPTIAQAYDAVQKQLKAQRDAESQGSGTTPPSGGHPPVYPPSGGPSGVPIRPVGPIIPEQPVDLPPAQKVKRRFFGKVQLPKTTAKMDFAKIYDEVLSHFALKHDGTVTITIEVEATSQGGFDEAFQRIIRENGGQLRFSMTEFEEE